MNISLGALALISAVFMFGATNPSQAETGAMTQLVPGYGKTAPVENPGEKPDRALDYKVVMSVTKAGEAGAPHGPATFAVLTAAGMTARGKGANPSEALIAQLKTAGVRVDVCGQALAGAKIARSEVLPDVQVDLSALTTLSTLQLKGYALLPD
jgi:intracellular sulfur oxidation DsrE/DsrF family protein